MSKAEHEIEAGCFLSGGRAPLDLADEDGRWQMSEVFGRVIQVRNLAVLLGSGSCFYLGSPSIRSMTRQEIQGLLDSCDVDLTAEASAVLDTLAPSNVDLEGVLERLTAAMGYAASFNVDTVQLAGTSASTVAVRDAYAALNLGLATACDLPVADAPTQALAPHVEFFRKLMSARRTDLPRVRLFTTNYDLVIEKALDEAGIQFLDGFRGGVTRHLDLSSFEADLFSSDSTSAGSLMRVHEVVHVYKIHGSLNWRRGTAPRPLLSGGIVQSSQQATADDLAVIYPTPAKDTDVLGYPYSDLLRIFGTTLSAPETALVVVGYGFADDHINRLIGQALAHNPTLQLLVIDPVGVLDESGECVADASSTTGALASSPDGRLGVLTGPAGCFDVVHKLLPDVGPTTARHAGAETVFLPGDLADG